MKMDAGPVALTAKNPRCGRHRLWLDLGQVFRLVSPSSSFPGSLPVDSAEDGLAETHGGGSAPDLHGIPFYTRRYPKWGKG